MSAAWLSFIDVTRWIASIILILGTLLFATNPVVAQSKTPTLTATYTFSDAVRSGSWTPLLVTVSDPLSRTLDLQIDTATGSPIGASIHVPITTYGISTSYTVYVPTTHDSSFPNVTVQLRDPVTLRRLGEAIPVVPSTGYWERGVTFAIVVPSGQSTSIQTSYTRKTTSMQMGFLPPAQLPIDRIGYDGIDVLMLYGIDLNKLDMQTQQAIVAWVEAGGRLIFWPSDHIQTGASPIAKILPATVGAIDSFSLATLSDKHQSSSGTNSVLARSLTPIEGAERIEFHEKFPPSIQARQGLGRVCVLPVDVFDVRSGQSNIDDQFAIDVLKGMVEFKTPYPSSQQLSPTLYDDYEASETAARQSALAHLANVSDLKTFNLTLLLWMMLGLTILVGPVDWFVLRALRRQPWTWFTTLGWAGVAAIGATLLAMTGRGGSSTYRSFTLIDQLDNRTIAKTQLACLYSSETRKFEIVQNSPEWWRIPWDGNFGSRRRSGSFIDFDQTADSNPLRPFTVKQWNVLVLENESLEDDGLKLETNLSIDKGRITGTIRNTTPWPIKSLDVMTWNLRWRVEQTIAPDESIDLSSITPGSASIIKIWESDWPEISIDDRRSYRAWNALEANSNAAILLARFENYDGPKLTDDANIEQQHSAIVRNILFLNQSGEK